MASQQVRWDQYLLETKGRKREGGREGLMILHVSAERAVNVFDKNAQLQNFSEACWDQVCRLRSMRSMVSR